MKHPTTDVLCVICGKRLKATESLYKPERWHVRKHKRPDGAGCLGHLVTTHQRA